jgi:hypothetical protein
MSTPEKPTIEATIAALIVEEAGLLEAIKAAEVRLTRVRTALTALEALTTDEPIEFDGKLSDACREVLRRSIGKSLSPMEVRDGLKTIGYDISPDKHKNIMASVHAVLKRMAESDKSVKSKDAKDGSGKRYWWAGDRPAQTRHELAAQLASSMPTTLTGQMFGAGLLGLPELANRPDASLAEALEKLGLSAGSMGRLGLVSGTLEDFLKTQQRLIKPEE